MPRERLGILCGRGTIGNPPHSQQNVFVVRPIVLITPSPLLLPRDLLGETLSHATAITEDKARLDFKVQAFRGKRYQMAFFDVRVFNPNVPSHRKLQLAMPYHRQEKEKQSKHEQRIREVELSSFTALVFSTSGGIYARQSPPPQPTCKRLASLLATKTKTLYVLAVSEGRIVL